MTITMRHVATALSLAGLLACSDASEPAPLADRIQFVFAPDTLGVGDSVQLLARPLDATNRELPDATVAWTSRSPAVVAVAATGEARALAEGDAWLVMSVGGAARGSDSVRVHVGAMSRSLHATVARDSLSPFDTVTVRTTIDTTLGAAVPDGSIRFESSDPRIAYVDSVTGKVTVRDDGDVSIAARAGARVASVALGAWLRPLATDGVRLVKVAFGWSFGCGLDAQGVAYCWGYNGFGQLGRGTVGGGTGGAFPFAPVQTAERFTGIVAGRGGACGITAAGALVCWGRSLGGIRPSAERGIPTNIPMPAEMGPVTRAFGGVRADFCAVDANAVHACFGDNSYQAIGDDATIVIAARPVPGAPLALGSIATGELHGCGTTPAGALWCWGDDGSWGANLSVAGYVAPTLVPGVPAMRKVTGNFQGTCALDMDGGVWCGGLTDDGTHFPMSRVTGIAAFARFESGLQNDCGMTAGGELLCRESSNVPLVPLVIGSRQFVPFSRRHRFTEFSVGHVGVCAITADGTTFCKAAMGGLQ